MASLDGFTPLNVSCKADCLHFIFWHILYPLIIFQFWYPSSNAYHGIQYIPRNMHTVFALLCFVVVIHWLIFPYPSGLLHWHCGNLTIAPVPAKQPWWIWINTSCEFIMNDCITTTEQSTTKPCAYFLGYTVTVFESTHWGLAKLPGICRPHFHMHFIIWPLLCFDFGMSLKLVHGVQLRT